MSSLLNKPNSETATTSLAPAIAFFTDLLIDFFACSLTGGQLAKEIENALLILPTGRAVGRNDYFNWPLSLRDGLIELDAPRPY